MKNRNIWSYGIAVVYVSFITIFLVLVIYFSFFHKQVDLVAENYYEQEVAYQTQIDRIRRTNSLPEEVKIQHHYERRQLLIQFPAGLNYTRIAGRVQFFRPSDAGQDRIVPIELSRQGNQEISTRDFQRGYWKIKIYWQINKEEFYSEESLVIN